MPVYSTDAQKEKTNSWIVATLKLMLKIWPNINDQGAVLSILAVQWIEQLPESEQRSSRTLLSHCIENYTMETL